MDKTERETTLNQEVAISFGKEAKRRGGGAAAAGAVGRAVVAQGRLAEKNAYGEQGVTAIS